jgi:hypothetical protein
MSEWQPIETAPHDTRVLVWIPPWYGPSDGKIIVASKFTLGWIDDEAIFLQSKPTHWQPLPAPPTTESIHGDHQ